jgi:hypothetical protein
MLLCLKFLFSLQKMGAEAISMQILLDLRTQSGLRSKKWRVSLRYCVKSKNGSTVPSRWHPCSYIQAEDDVRGNDERWGTEALRTATWERFGAPWHDWTQFGDEDRTKSSYDPGDTTHCISQLLPLGIFSICGWNGDRVVPIYREPCLGAVLN